jgi:hypothetical protein
MLAICHAKASQELPDVGSLMDGKGVFVYVSLDSHP